MNDSLYVGAGGIGWLGYHTKRIDEKDPRTEYVASMVFKNVGSGWYRSIEFGGPDAIDHLIAALVHVKAQQAGCGYFDDWKPGEEGYAGKERENTFNSLIRCNREFHAKRDGDAWVCRACGEKQAITYYDKPLFCSHCGSFFNEYEEES